ncbi:hypothetical protein [Polyangium aurulentum]|uniref:hypothetical protein n=1 Tax=Polyangium aurulentum TaxID=2567896 RepID=UPI0010AEB46F|nr:hypothetical protein [Polyangium aurulentum]UQA57844.1 hypothetical protein E8A73_042300 [Polyangium aurulentum]
MQHSFCGAVAFVFLVLVTTDARGQDAAALFEKGVDEMEAGHFDVACPAIAQSQQLDPRPGTLFTLAECERQAGRIATSVTHYAEYLRQVEGMTPGLKKKHKERAEIAETERKALEPNIPRLVLVLPANAPPGVLVTRDGAEVDAASLGVALPVDPGEHVITSRVPGGPLVEQRVTLAKKETKTLQLEVHAPKEPAQEKTPSAPAAESAARGLPPTQPATSTAQTSSPDVTRKPASDTQSIPGWAWGVGLGGLAALGVGVGFAVDYGLVRSAVAKDCAGGTCREPGQADPYIARWNRDVGLAATFGTLGAVGIGVAVIGAVSGRGATGRERAAAIAPWAAPGAGGVSFSGQF